MPVAIDLTTKLHRLEEITGAASNLQLAGDRLPKDFLDLTEQ